MIGVDHADQAVVQIPSAAGEVEAGPDDETAPLPVILAQRGPDDPSQESEEQTRRGRPQSGSAGQDTDRMRGPFEPAVRPHSSSASLSPSAAKLEQIKDLYLTAEAIGEDALAKHFQQVSERQRQLIREYFDQAIKGAADGGTS